MKKKVKKRRYSSFGKYTKKALEKESNGKCGYCYKDCIGYYHIDHIQPYSKKGKEKLDNLILVCESCNFSKRDKTLEEWIGFLMIKNRLTQELFNFALNYEKNKKRREKKLEKLFLISIKENFGLKTIKEARKLWHM